MNALDQTLFLLVNLGGEAPSVLITLARLLARHGQWLVIPIALAAWVGAGRGARSAVCGALLDATLAALLVRTVNRLIQSQWSLPRPFALGLGDQHLAHAANASFPSDHAAALAAISFALLACRSSRGAGGALLLLALAVGWARIAVGVHFPLDVASGVALAGLAAMTVRVMRLSGLRLRAMFQDPSALDSGWIATGCRRLGLRRVTARSSH